MRMMRMMRMRSKRSAANQTMLQVLLLLFLKTPLILLHPFLRTFPVLLLHLAHLPLI
jgi:hypothetical protein